MRTPIPTAERLAVGPVTDVGGHGPVTIIHEMSGMSDTVPPLYICLDCGFTTGERRQFQHTDCDRSLNPIEQTWREYLDDEPFPGIVAGEDES